ncbi:septum site-determining protein MinC [Cellulosilyticum ruminicola]|uniref:septum site-determining protein MinC n=1 Tax=Cellulosilyticum ruminicola TaxID=425254 RepID=UPI0006CFF080|nr:septum site-determining protein MinC [Cellulosilyticum ruminicola]
MREENLVVFKGTVDGIIVFIDPKADFEIVLQHFKAKLEESKKFFKGTKVSVRFKGRVLSEREQGKLLEILTNQESIHISFIHPFEGEIKEEKTEMLWVREQLRSFEGSMTHFHYGIVRSGHHIEYRGNVVVLGDVNPGGLISAGGNVIILGALKGKVCAGLDEKVPHPFIVSTSMAPIQIGIRSVIAKAPEGDAEALYRKSENGPLIAYLQDGQIYMDQIDLKTLNHMLK